MIRLLGTHAAGQNSRRRARTRSPWQTVQGWLALSRQRADLARLDDHMLRDVGLSRYAAVTEAERPFWDAPDHWHDRRINS